MGRVEDRMVFHWELEAAFLWDVTLGLVEAENRERDSRKQSMQGEGGEEPQPRSQPPPDLLIPQALKESAFPQGHSGF